MENCHLKHEHPPQNPDYPIRAFDPNWNELYRGAYSDIIGACPACLENKLKVQKSTSKIPREVQDELDGQTVVVAIDGACRNNGLPTAVASYGVFYGRGAVTNLSGLVPDAQPQTNQVAEVYAAIVALEGILDRAESWSGDGQTFCKVLVVTDSSYLVKGISEYVWKWKTNGYRNAKGKPVVNGTLFEKLDLLIEKCEDTGTPVWFWHVRREFNQEADALANEALDMV